MHRTSASSRSPASRPAVQPRSLASVALLDRSPGSALGIRSTILRRALRVRSGETSPLVLTLSGFEENAGSVGEAARASHVPIGARSPRRGPRTWVRVAGRAESVEDAASAGARCRRQHAAHAPESEAAGAGRRRRTWIRVAVCAGNKLSLPAVAKPSHHLTTGPISAARARVAPAARFAVRAVTLIGPAEVRTERQDHQPAIPVEAKTARARLTRIRITGRSFSHEEHLREVLMDAPERRTNLTVSIVETTGALGRARVRIANRSIPDVQTLEGDTCVLGRDFTVPCSRAASANRFAAEVRDRDPRTAQDQEHKHRELHRSHVDVLPARHALTQIRRPSSN